MYLRPRRVLTEVLDRRRFSLGLFAGFVILVLAAAWPAGRTSASDRAVSQAAGSPAAIVGLWLVAPYPDRPSDMEVAIFDAGGFMFSSSSPSMAPAPGQAAPGVSQVFGSSGFGL